MRDQEHSLIDSQQCQPRGYLRKAGSTTNLLTKSIWINSMDTPKIDRLESFLYQFFMQTIYLSEKTIKIDRGAHEGPIALVIGFAAMSTPRFSSNGYQKLSTVAISCASRIQMCYYGVAHFWSCWTAAWKGAARRG